MTFSASSTEPNTWYVEAESCQDIYRLKEVFDEAPEAVASVQEASETTDVPPTFSEQDFQVAQGKLIAYVRDVNWKTGLHLTLRDATFSNV